MLRDRRDHGSDGAVSSAMEGQPMKILAKLVGSAALGFFNTNAGKKFYISSAPVPADLNAAGMAALTWVQVSGVGNFGETGNTTNILTYDTWDDSVVRKAKGMTNAGDPEVEVARDPADAGQILMQTAAAGNFNWGFKVEGNDAPNDNAESEPTIRYNRGLVVGPRNPNGRNEDFDLDVYSLGLQMKQITVAPVDGTAP